MSIGISTYRERLTEELEDSKPTELFSKYVNNLFDALNRRYPGEGIHPGSPDLDVSTEQNSEYRKKKEDEPTFLK